MGTAYHSVVSCGWTPNSEQLYSLALGYPRPDKLRLDPEF